MLAVAIMAATYVTITPANYRWFVAAAVVSGVLGFLSVSRFDRLRKLHVVPIPLVSQDGSPLRDKKGAAQVNNVVIASEDTLRPEAAAALKEARQSRGLSVRQFMAGYGNPVNDPEALWDRGILADISNRLTISLMYVVLLAVLTVFLAAFVIEVANRGRA